MEKVEAEKKHISNLVKTFKKSLKVPGPASYYYDTLIKKINIPVLALEDCIYSTESLDEEIHKSLDVLYNEIQNGKITVSYNPLFEYERDDAFPEAWKKVILTCLKGIRNRYVCCAKHYTFCEEAECRMIYYGANLRDLVEFIGDKPRIPTCLRNPIEFIDEIMLGPSSNAQKNRLYLEMICEKYKLFPRIKISQSASPYIGN